MTNMNTCHVVFVVLAAGGAVAVVAIATVVVVRVVCFRASSFVLVDFAVVALLWQSLSLWCIGVIVDFDVQCLPSTSNMKITTHPDTIAG